ncbi:MAG TPA: penicillin-binding protein 2, partial [Leptospiraceae bacterium]|nr:penicillin-binding protein 2 [Leptospiraceae bacterium]
MVKVHNRARIFAGAITIALGLLFARIVFLVVSTDATAVDQKEGIVRGPILDRRGISLARTEEASAIAIAPPEVLDTEFAAQNLSKHLGIPPAEIVEKIYQQSNRRYFYLKHQVDNFTADRIMDLRIPGVHREYEFKRLYPAGRLAGNLLGFVGRDPTTSLSGLERSYHDLLNRAEMGERRGPALYLTIDSLIQSKLEKEMRAAYESSGAKRATGVFMDLDTGEILAMASFPELDPNDYQVSRPDQRENWGIRMAYEPGSTVKVLMAAILLKNNAVRPDEKFFCNGEYKVGNVTVRCRVHGKMFAHGEVTLSDIITKSCNVGIIQAMSRIPPEKLNADLRALGFGERTDLLPPGSGEAPGYLPEIGDWVPSSRIYFPIGQGFSVSPVQLLRAAGSIANGGTLLQPTLARQAVAQNGKILFEHTPIRAKNPFEPAVNREVLRYMRRVVLEGTGRAALISDVAIAGKTGTGQKSSAKGYYDKYVASFLGFFPAQNPRYGGLLIFDEAGEESGGSLAAPVFARFVQSILPVLNESSQTFRVPDLAPIAQSAAAFEAGKIGDFRGMSARE